MVIANILTSKCLPNSVGMSIINICAPTPRKLVVKGFLWSNSSSSNRSTLSIWSYGKTPFRRIRSKWLTVHVSTKYLNSSSFSVFDSTSRNLSRPTDMERYFSMFCGMMRTFPNSLFNALTINGHRSPSNCALQLVASNYLC